MGIFLEGEDSHGDHGLGRLVEFRFKAPPGTTSSSITTHTSLGQRNCASWASQPQKSVTLLPCPGGRTTKSTKDVWWHWGGKYIYIYIFDSRLLLRCIKCDANQMDVSPWSTPHLFSLTQHGFILTEMLHLHVCYTFRMYFDHLPACQHKYHHLVSTIRLHTRIQQHCHRIQHTHLLILLINVLLKFCPAPKFTNRVQRRIF